MPISSNNINYFFYINPQKRLHCTKIRAQLLYPRLDFADSAVAKLTRKKNWSACPSSMGYPLTDLPIFHQIIISSLKTRWVVEEDVRIVAILVDYLEQQFPAMSFSVFDFL